MRQVETTETFMNCFYWFFPVQDVSFYVFSNWIPGVRQSFPWLSVWCFGFCRLL